jgi:hypothetical protein
MHTQVYHGGINTNNHQEAMNRVFKAKWLNNRMDQRMDSLLRTYVSEIEPHYWREYVLAQASAIRCVSLFVMAVKGCVCVCACVGAYVYMIS